VQWKVIKAIFTSFITKEMFLQKPWKVTCGTLVFCRTQFEYYSV